MRTSETPEFQNLLQKVNEQALEIEKLKNTVLALVEVHRNTEMHLSQERSNKVHNVLTQFYIDTKYS